MYKRGEQLSAGSAQHISPARTAASRRKKRALSARRILPKTGILNLKESSGAERSSARRPFAQAAEQFLREYEIITEGQRNAQYVEGHGRRLKLHLLPFFGQMGLSEISAGQAAGVPHSPARKGDAERGKPPARNTLHQEIVCLRQVLKTAIRHGWLNHLPDLSEPFRSSEKISHRAWFSPEEYRTLYEATRERTRNPKRKRYPWEYEQLHDYVLFMANTGLRPDEAARLEYRDVKIVRDDATNETILEIEVRGKRGVGYCKSTTGAVRAVPATEEAKQAAADRSLFPKTAPRTVQHHPGRRTGLKFDREGNRRTAYSLRHTYVCFRLMEGADIYQIAKNCRTSVEMIEKYYASHIKTSLDAAAINVTAGRRPWTKYGTTSKLGLGCESARTYIEKAPRGRGGTGRRNGLEEIECARGKPETQNCSNSGEPVRWQSRAKPRRGRCRD